MKKAFFNWSGGKDSAFALYEILHTKTYQIDSLLTSISQTYQRVSMHGVRKDLLLKQARTLDLPLEILEIPPAPTMEQYDNLMREKMTIFHQQGFEYAIYGDIFLEDLRQYREQKLAEIEMKGVFPIWKRDTLALAKQMIALGFKAITVCVNAKLLDKSFVGRQFDQDFLNDLPLGIDPCGENGEFHTFVYDAPVYAESIDFEIGKKVFRTYQKNEGKDDTDTNQDNTNWDTGFWHCDLIGK